MIDGAATLQLAKLEGDAAFFWPIKDDKALAQVGPRLADIRREVPVVGCGFRYLGLPPLSSRSFLTGGGSCGVRNPHPGTATPVFGVSLEWLIAPVSIERRAVLIGDRMCSFESCMQIEKLTPKFAAHEGEVATQKVKQSPR